MGSHGKGGGSQAAPSLEALLRDFGRQLDEEKAGVDAASLTPLLAMAIATNSADACAVSVDGMQHHMTMVADELGQLPPLLTHFTP